MDVAQNPQELNEKHISKQHLLCVCLSVPAAGGL